MGQGYYFLCMFCLPFRHIYIYLCIQYIQDILLTLKAIALENMLL